MLDFDVWRGVERCESMNLGGKSTAMKEVMLEDGRRRNYSFLSACFLLFQIRKDS